ncbi:CobW family GTP-binding protein [Streptomyces sparsogenes]|uniref:Putative ATP/GTP-binding protein n=1 Tax=Streptomyces sparsogenes DSM 40356 TaxID=1331668 RepID=A0A1R1S9Z5_9ACTN|nr:GTP-binding protein [Streptomyces sparsogenes]OMI35032.1 putative ATP/GTP-binding protein [Streptomyces sparsogenes DSM 40356]
MTTKRIPVVLVTGFLGSGKTTMLNHLLRGSADTRIGVIVNDFGSINIDAMAVAGQVDSMIPIENGCLCCAADSAEMDAMLARLTEPSLGIDVIVVEASGLAEPQSMIRTLLSSELEHVLYGGLVEVVDAAEFENTRERHPEIERHVRAADAVVLNKADRVPEPELTRLLEALARIAPGTPVVTAEHGRVDPGFLFDRGAGAPVEERFRQLSFADVCADEHGEHGEHEWGEHLHAAYESVEFVADRPLDPRRFMAFLDSRPAGLYRMKGFLHFAAPGHGEKFALHAVGSYLRFQPSPWAGGEARTTQLVMIGAGIDAEALTKELTGCVAAGPDAVGDHHMMGVLRYVRDRDEDRLDVWDEDRDE